MKVKPFSDLELGEVRRYFRAVGKILVGPFCLLKRQFWFLSGDWIGGGQAGVEVTFWKTLAVIQVGSAPNWG